MKQLTISVPNMKSTHCQMRVNNAVQEIEGVQIENVEAGALTVSFDLESQRKEVVSAIEKTGYSVSEEKYSNHSVYNKGCCNNS
ncbi:heavy-metal-associated domain-containing protein [Polluticaenibacter yanchengensis]|uniref:Heavy-metal-associated domain-containing protein n=1 Tax=Polluticaenibacter yanchengensis TaxID=3014562 RepID=A0ABT4UNV2_9BACT|nr:heavy-metal-associated domain-containing protein [Chitinophagaceae bacterium LY-5]